MMKSDCNSFWQLLLLNSVFLVCLSYELAFTNHYEKKDRFMYFCDAQNVIEGFSLQSCFDRLPSSYRYHVSNNVSYK